MLHPVLHAANINKSPNISSLHNGHIIVYESHPLSNRVRMQYPWCCLVHFGARPVSGGWHADRSSAWRLWVYGVMRCISVCICTLADNIETPILLSLHCKKPTKDSRHNTLRRLTNDSKLSDCVLQAPLAHLHDKRVKRLANSVSLIKRWKSAARLRPAACSRRALAQSLFNGWGENGGSPRMKGIGWTYGLKYTPSQCLWGDFLNKVSSGDVCFMPGIHAPMKQLIRAVHNSVWDIVHDIL